MPAGRSLRSPGPPAVGPVPWRFPAPVVLTLDNGLSVYLHDLPRQHRAAIFCHVRAEAGGERADLAGVTGVMAAAMCAGTRLLRGEQLAARSAETEMTWSAAPGWTGPLLTCQLPVAQLPAGLSLLGQVLSQPSFCEQEVGQETRLAIARLVAADADPAARLVRLLPAAAYGAGAPAGRPLDGTPGTLAGITSGVVRARYDACARPASTTVVIAGDLAGLEVAELAATALASWRDPRPPYGSPVTVPLRHRRPAAILARQPGALRTQFQLAACTPGRDHPSWPALTVATHVIGSQIAGRLDSRLREDGVDCDIRATLTEHLPGAGMLLISGTVLAARAVPALREVIGMVESARRDGFDPDELAIVIEAIAGSTPPACRTAGDVAAITSDLVTSGLPPDFYDQLLSRISDLRARRVAGALRAHLGHGRLKILVAGDADVLTEPLADLVRPHPLQVV